MPDPLFYNMNNEPEIREEVGLTARNPLLLTSLLFRSVFRLVLGTAHTCVASQFVITFQFVINYYKLERICNTIASQFVINYYKLERYYKLGRNTRDHKGVQDSNRTHILSDPILTCRCFGVPCRMECVHQAAGISRCPPRYYGSVGVVSGLRNSSFHSDVDQSVHLMPPTSSGNNVSLPPVLHIPQ